MKIDVEDLGNLKVRMTVNVEPERMEKEKIRLARAYSHHVSVRGFRPGHVPTELVIRQIGPAFEAELQEHVLGETFKEALKEKSLSPSSEPALKVVDPTTPGGMTYVTEFESLPVIEVKDYLGVEVEQPDVPPVTDQDVDAALDRLRNAAAKTEPKADDGVAEPDDPTVCELVHCDPDTGSELRRDTDVRLTAGISDSPIPGIGKAILGLKVGESKDVTGTLDGLPPTAEGAEPAPRPVRTTVHVRQVLHRVLPALDDDFAHSFAGAESLATWREQVRARLEQNRIENQKTMLTDRVIDAIIKANPVEVGAETVGRMADAAESATRDRLLPNLPPEERAKIDLGIPRDLSENQARETLARQIVLGAIADKEDVQVTDEDFAARLSEIAAETGMPLPRLMARLSGEDGDHLRRRLRVEKTIDMLTRYAVVVPKTTAPADEVPPPAQETDKP